MEAQKHRKIKERVQRVQTKTVKFQLDLRNASVNATSGCWKRVNMVVTAAHSTKAFEQFWRKYNHIYIYAHK